jgi:20S proteasome subunit alpha 6
LIQHALQAIRGCLQGDQELSADNISVAIVGVDQPFKIIEGKDLQPYVCTVNKYLTVSQSNYATYSFL